MLALAYRSRVSSFVGPIKALSLARVPSPHHQSHTVSRTFAAAPVRAAPSSLNSGSGSSIDVVGGVTPHSGAHSVDVVGGVTRIKDLKVDTEVKVAGKK